MGDVNIGTEDHVAVITVPETMTGESAFDLRDACLQARQDDGTWVVVLPRWQRQGIGGRLLQALRRCFTAHETTKVIVDAPPDNPSRAFYLKHGAIPLYEYWVYWENIGEVSGI